MNKTALSEKVIEELKRRNLWEQEEDDDDQDDDQDDDEDNEDSDEDSTGHNEDFCEMVCQMLHSQKPKMYLHHYNAEKMQ